MPAEQKSLDRRSLPMGTNVEAGDVPAEKSPQTVRFFGFFICFVKESNQLQNSATKWQQFPGCLPLEHQEAPSEWWNSGNPASLAANSRNKR
jgi:hypothetical protein